jgi:hypothetical protein
LLQHRANGGYGYFGPQLPQVKATVGEGFSPDRDLHLPVTLGCLLTLAEVTTGWRMYRDLPRADPGSAAVRPGLRQA